MKRNAFTLGNQKPAGRTHLRNDASRQDLTAMIPPVARRSSSQAHSMSGAPAVSFGRRLRATTGILRL